MKNLLIAVLLAIFSIQAAMVAVSGPTPVVFSTQADAGPDMVSQQAAESDRALSASAIEELSDYLPATLSFGKATFTAPPSLPVTLMLLSIDLPRIEPPPRT